MIWVLEREDTGEPVACGLGEPGAEFKATAGFRLEHYINPRGILALAFVLRRAASEIRATAYSGDVRAASVPLLAGRSDGLDIAAALLEPLGKP